MSHYRVSYFKNLLSSDGHPFKCLQRCFDIPDSKTAEQAAEIATQQFARLHGSQTGRTFADSVEVEIVEEALTQ